MDITTYDPKLCTVSVAGTYLRGFSDGGKVTIEKNEDNTTYLTGVDGDVNYSINNDNTATATLPLVSSSPDLAFLRQLAVDREEFNFTMVDMNENGINISVDSCRIIKTPDYSRMKEQEEVEIEILIPFLVK